MEHTMFLILVGTGIEINGTGIEKRCEGVR